MFCKQTCIVSLKFFVMAVSVSTGFPPKFQEICYIYSWDVVIMVPGNDGYHKFCYIWEFCFTIVQPVLRLYIQLCLKPVLSADDVGFKPKLGCTAKKSFFTATVILLEKLSYHYASCFVKKNSKEGFITVHSVSKWRIQDLA